MAKGKRIQSRRVTPRPTGRRAAPKGKRQQPAARHSKLLQMVASAIVLVTVVAVKLTLPEAAQHYGGKLLDLIGENTDFVAAFSSVGRAVGGEDLADTITDVYTAVFGPQKVPAERETDRNAVVYGSSVTPQRVDMLQQVLGFAYAAPVEGRVSSAFGYRDHPVQGTERFHYGIDLACEKGTVIGAFAAGTVTAVAESSELGKYVELTHASGFTTLYAHCSRINASTGQTVKVGDPIAEAGDTGDATGPHLHFELHHNSVYLNPIYYVS